jgi:hypothetical protein
MHAPLVEWPAVFPYGLFGRDLDEAEFTRKYRHRLHRQRRRILAELQEMREGYDAPLVLLCFEGPDRFCHRLVLGCWLAEQLGEEIEEVMPDP